MNACRTCEKQLGKKNASGYCGPCLLRARNADPEFRQKAIAAQRMAMASDPAKREAARQRAATNRNTPRAKAARAGLVTPERMRAMAERKNALYPKGCDERKRAGASRSATILSDIPPHLRPLYREMIRKHMTAAEARGLIAAQHELELARWRANSTCSACSRHGPRRGRCCECLFLAR